jgi:hypothetical protein
MDSDYHHLRLRVIQIAAAAAKLKQAAGVVCLALTLATAAILLSLLVFSVLRGSREPLQFWLFGVLSIGVLALAAGILLKQTEE